MSVTPRVGGKRALALAARDEIRKVLEYGPVECEVMLDGRPPPVAGSIFVSVYHSGQANQAMNSLDVSHGLMVTISMRIEQPYDRLGTDLLALESKGLDDRVMALVDLVHMNYAVLDRANQFLVQGAPDGTRVYGFAEPLVYDGHSTYGKRGGEWFHAMPEARESAVVADVRFGRARRLEDLDTLEYLET